jgi:hypothetical protein
MTKTIRTADGLVGYPVQTKRGPRRNYGCTVCSACAPKRWALQHGTYEDMNEWWEEHKMNTYHQRKMGALSNEVLSQAAAKQELIQREKALARIRSTRETTAS